MMNPKITLLLSYLAIILMALNMSACAGTSGRAVSALSEEEKHRLYSAALAASESPLETEIFKEVCKKIGIFDAVGGPNDNYMAFVAAHVDWALKPELEQFKREINTREKAREYINEHLPQ